MLAAPLSSLSRDELLERVREVERAARMLSAAQLAVTAELERRGTAAELGASSTAALLGELLRLDRCEAAGRVWAAQRLAPRTTLAGEPVAAQFPQTAQLLADGAVSLAHATTVVRAVEALPDPVRELEWDAIESTLSGLAVTLTPSQVAAAGRHVHDVLDPDGTLADEAEQHRRRELTLRPRRDGSAVIEGRLTGECLATWQAVFDALAAPRPGEDCPDTRSAAQRTHDALLEAGRMVLRAEQLPAAGGAPATVLLSMTLEQLEQRTGLVTTAHGGSMSVPAALKLAADAHLVPALFGDCGELLAHGRSRRLATAAQRLALAARDRGCTFPGCTVPPAWCETHHVIAWADGGTTDLDNLTLVCGYHHRYFESAGWAGRMVDGIPHWIPPAWTDPHQHPRHNTAHHPERLITVSQAEDGQATTSDSELRVPQPVPQPVP